jgi:hypothetical protein
MYQRLLDGSSVGVGLPLMRRWPFRLRQSRAALVRGAVGNEIDTQAPPGGRLQISIVPPLASTRLVT